MEEIGQFDAAKFRATHQKDKLMRQLVAFFGEDTSRYLRQAREALIVEDSTTLHLASRALKGILEHFCAERAFELSRQLEQAARTGDFRAASPLLGACEKEIQNLGKALLQFAATLKVE